MRSTVTTAVHYSRHARRTHRDHGPLDEVLRAQVPHRGQFKAQKSNHDKVNFASVFIGAQKALAAIPSCTGRHRHWSLNSVRDTSHPTVNDRPNTPIQCGSAARARSAVWQQPPCEGSPGRARLSPGYSVYVVGLLGLSGRGPLPFRGVCPTPPVRAFFSLPWAHEHEKQRQSGLAGQPSGAPALPVAHPAQPAAPPPAARVTGCAPPSARAASCGCPPPPPLASSPRGISQVALRCSPATVPPPNSRATAARWCARAAAPDHGCSSAALVWPPHELPAASRVPPVAMTTCVAV